MGIDAIKVQVNATRTPSDGELYGLVMETLTYAYDASAPNRTITISASAAHPVFIHEITHVVTTAFTATATVDVGDGTDADHYIDTTDMAVDVQYNVTSSKLAASAHPGDYIVADATIVVTVGGTVSAGAGRLNVLYSRF